MRAAPARQGTSTVLLALAAGQFLMTLDSSVMNVSIATVAKGVGTTVTGVQTAITLYTLVMAMLMATRLLRRPSRASAHCCPETRIPGC
jgi:MFS family permease